MTIEESGFDGGGIVDNVPFPPSHPEVQHALVLD